MRQNRFLHFLCTIGASIYWLINSNEINGAIPLEYWRTPIGCESTQLEAMI